MQTQIDSFSGRQIYPGYGLKYFFSGSKTKQSFNNHWNPRNVNWTSVSRKAHNKDVVIQQKKNTNKKNVTAKRSYGTATVSKLEELRKKYAQQKTQ